MYKLMFFYIYAINCKQQGFQ